MAKNPAAVALGRKGGKKGGLTTKERYGADFYRNIGRKGGSK